MTEINGGKKIVSRADISSLVRKLNKADNEYNWEVKFEDMFGDDLFFAKLFSEKTDGSTGPNQGSMKFVILNRGYMVVPHDVHGCVSDVALNVFDKFTQDKKLPPCSMFVMHEMTDDVMEQIYNKLGKKAWEPALYTEMREVAAFAAEYTLEKYGENSEVSQLFLKYVTEFLSSGNYVQQGYLADRMKAFHEVSPEFKDQVNWEAVNRYNHGDPDSLFLIVTAQYEGDDTKYLRPTPLNINETVQMLFIGYKNAINSILF